MASSAWKKTSRGGFSRSLDGYQLSLKEGPDQWFWSVRKGNRIYDAGESETHILAARAAEGFVTKRSRAIMPSREDALALVRHGRRPPKLLTAGGPPVITTSGVEVPTRSHAMTTKKKSSKKKSSKKTTKKTTGNPRKGATKTVKAKNGRTMIFKWNGTRWVLSGNVKGLLPGSKKAGKKKSTSKKTTKKAGKKKTKKKTTKKSSSGARVTKGERELARRLVSEREENARLRKQLERCGKPARKKTKKTTSKKTAKKATRKASSGRGEGNVTAAQILGGTAAKSKIKGVGTMATTRGKGRRAKPMKMWVCAGPTYTGCGGGKKGLQGSHMIGHVTDPRAIRRLSKK